MSTMTLSPKHLCSNRFDYNNLDTEVSQFVQQQTGEIQALVKRTAQDIIKIGQKLILVKEKLGHGRFTDWIGAEFEWSYPTAARFMQVADRFGEIYQIDRFASSALYVLAAPSTPEAAVQEALALAKTGKRISYSAARAIRQKYSLPAAKSKQAVSQTKPPEALQTSEPVAHQIVALHPQQPQSQPQLSVVAQPEIVSVAYTPQIVTRDMPQLSQPARQPEQHYMCWHLQKDHWLYCGEPNSPELRQQLPQKLKLLLAFPPLPSWQTEIPAETRIIATRYLPKGKNSLLEYTLEGIINLYTEVGETIAICYLPFPEILDVVNRFDRRGIVIEPDYKQVQEIISYWKKGGMKVKQAGTRNYLLVEERNEGKAS